MDKNEEFRMIVTNLVALNGSKLGIGDATRPARDDALESTIVDVVF